MTERERMNYARLYLEKMADTPVHPSKANTME